MPGAFEAPLVAKRLAASGTVDAVICLGAVIRGETAHFEYVAGETAAGHHARRARHGHTRDLRRAHRRRSRPGARPSRRQGRTQGRRSRAHRDRDGVAAPRPAVTPLRHDRRAPTRRRAGPIRASPRRSTAAIGAGGRVVNVGAGTGSYEPADRFVVAVDPSLTMLRQRPHARGARGAWVAPRRCRSATARSTSRSPTLTVHHWDDLERGLREMRARRAPPGRVLLRAVADRPSSGWSPSTSPRSSTCRPSAPRPGLERLADILAVHTRRARRRPGRLPGRLRRLLLEPARGVPRSGRAGRHVVLRAARPRDPPARHRATAARPRERHLGRAPRRAARR